MLWLLTVYTVYTRWLPRSQLIQLEMGFSQRTSLTPIVNLIKIASHEKRQMRFPRRDKWLYLLDIMCQLWCESELIYKHFVKKIKTFNALGRRALSRVDADSQVSLKAFCGHPHWVLLPPALKPCMTLVDTIIGLCYAFTLIAELASTECNLSMMRSPKVSKLLH